MFIKIIIDATILLDHTHTYDNIDTIMDMLTNGKFIEQQAAMDIEGEGINEEVKTLAEKEIEKRLEEIKKGGKNAKNGKKSRTIQENRNQNKKNKCKPDD